MQGRREGLGWTGTCRAPVPGLRRGGRRRPPMIRDELLAAAVIESERARKLFPQPNHVTLALAEEAGEVVKAALDVRQGKATLHDLRKELTQTIAMCLRLAEEGDPTIGVTPVLDLRAARSSGETTPAAAPGAPEALFTEGFARGFESATLAVWQAGDARLTQHLREYATTMCKTTIPEFDPATLGQGGLRTPALVAPAAATGERAAAIEALREQAALWEIRAATMAVCGDSAGANAVRRCADQLR